MCTWSARCFKNGPGFLVVWSHSVHLNVFFPLWAWVWSSYFSFKITLIDKAKKLKEGYYIGLYSKVTLIDKDRKLKEGYYIGLYCKLTLIDKNGKLKEGYYS